MTFNSLLGRLEKETIMMLEVDNEIHEIEF